VSTLPTHPPASFAAGTTVRFTQGAVTTALGEVSPAAGWSLAWHVRGIGEADATVTSDGTRWTVSLPATATQALTAGGYTAVLRASRSGDVIDLAVQQVTVTVDLANAVAGELQTWEERTLAVVEAALSGNLTDGVQFYMIGDQQVNRIPLDKLMAIRTQLQSAVAQQRSASGFGRPVLMTAVFHR
jgi:hypothetical protein